MHASSINCCIIKPIKPTENYCHNITHHWFTIITVPSVKIANETVSNETVSNETVSNEEPSKTYIVILPFLHANRKIAITWLY